MTPVERIGGRLAWLEALLEAAGENAELFDDGASEFLDSIKEKVAEYGDCTMISPRQLAWLKSIEAELRRNNVRPGEDVTEQLSF